MKMTLDFVRFLKICHYLLYCIIFIILFILCYFFYMNEAIEKSNARATTVIKQSEKFPYEIPSIVICPEPGFKPSLLESYNISARKLFLYGKFEDEVFQNQSVQKTFEEITYANDFDFTFGDQFRHVQLNPGMNEIDSGSDKITHVELKTVPTEMSGTCHILQYESLSPKAPQNSNETWGRIIISYNKLLNLSDIPKGFRIYFTQINGWYSVVFDGWFGHQEPFTFNILTQSFTTIAWINPLYREYYYPLLSKTEVANQNMNSSLKTCLKPSDIKKIRNAQNCSEHCVPFVFSSFFDISQIQVCKTFVDHFCAFNKLHHHIYEQISSCMKPSVEKYFKGRVKFTSLQDDIEYPKTFNDDKKKKTLVILSWKYQNQLTTVIKEKLVYDSKDLLAWLGGALGIFVGYSFFDFAKHIIDIIFYCAYRKMNSQ